MDLQIQAKQLEIHASNLDLRAARIQSRFSCVPQPFFGSVHPFSTGVAESINEPVTSAIQADYPIRVVLAGLPSMLRILIRAALCETEMIVTEATTYAEAVSMLGSIAGTGVVIVPTAATGLANAYTEAVCQDPHVKCLPVSTSPRRTDLFELRLLGADVGRRDVVDAILRSLQT